CRRSRRAGPDRSHARTVRAPDDPLRPCGHAACRPAAFSRPAHAHAGRLVARPRRRVARRCRAGADERDPGPARVDPAAADERRGALQRPGRPAVIALVQRVSQASVDVAGATIGRIDAGLLVFVCAEPNDTELVADKLVAKLLKLRIFADDAGKMNRSVADVQGGLLIVSQFTLA